MIIYALITVIITVLGVLLAPLPNIPALPSAAQSFLDDAVEYIQAGFAFLYSFCFAEVVVALLNVTITVLLVYEGWQFIRFVLRKIPMLGIS